MKLNVIYSKCDNPKGGDDGPPCCASGKCPTLYTTEDGRIVVQGYKLDTELANSIDFAENETAVVLSKEFLEECIKAYRK